MSTTPDDEPEDDELDVLAPPPPPPWPEPPAELDDELLLLLLLLLPPTVSPTLALTAVIVPLIGERSTVSRTAFRAEATARRSWATCSCVLRDRRRVDGRVDRRLRGVDRLLLLLDRQLLLRDRALRVGDRGAIGRARRGRRREGLHEAAGGAVRVRGDDPEDVGGRGLQPVDRPPRPCSRSCRCRRWRWRSSIRTTPSGRTGSSRSWPIPWD